MSTSPEKHDPRLEQAGATDESIQEVHAILLREKPEPKEGYTPMPLFLLGFISAMIFICAIYLVRYRGGFDPLVYDERFDPALAVGATGKPTVDPVVQGKKLFQICSTCHQATGTGIPGTYPPLAGSEWVNGSDERLIRVLLHGLTGQVEVKGAVYNGNMPAFGVGSGYNWSDEKISYVITYIRQEWGNTSTPVTPEAVKAVRESVARTANWTQGELDVFK